MKFLSKLKSDLYREYYFWSEQKLGWKTPVDPYCIPKHFVKKYLPTISSIIDCGANDGADSVELARIFPNSIVHCFEPVPSVYRALKANTEKYKNIRCYELALSSVTGTAKMYVSSGSSDASSSLLAPKDHLNDHPTVLFDNEIIVNTITLDDWADRYKITSIDFLWLDMQGSEFDMLSRSKKILSTVKAIHSEVSTKESYENAKLYPEFRKWLEEKGFSVVKEALPEGSDAGNVLLVKKAV